MDIRNVNNKTYGWALYGSLLEEKNVKEIKRFMKRGTGQFSHHRRFYAVITAYIEYCRIHGYDMGKMCVEYRYIKNPKTGRYFAADVWLEYKGKQAVLEDDTNHENQKEKDRERDICTQEIPFTEVLRFITQGNDNIAIDTAKCYMLKGERNKGNPKIVKMIDEDILTIFRALNEFYGLCLYEKAILKYFKTNIRYKASYFLTEEEIEGIKEKELEDEKRNSSNKNRVIQKLQNGNQTREMKLCYI